MGFTWKETTILVQVIKDISIRDILSNNAEVLKFLRDVFLFLLHADINECLTANCAGFCEEVGVGSYSCGCYAGFVLHSDGRSCVGE